MAKPIASLSLDLDNKWAYLRTHGNPAWRSYPSYLAEVAPRISAQLADHGVCCTVFVVGQDLDLPDGRDAVQLLAAAGHEIGNHSQNHYPWLDRLSAEEREQEVASSEQAITDAVGVRPVGFRAPGFSGSPGLLSLLAERGYQYDASAFPTITGPLAKWYSRARLSTRAGAYAEQGIAPAEQSFPNLSEAFRTLRPHLVETDSGNLGEAPVTTMPLLRVPIHVTYFTFLAQFSTSAAKAYLSTALTLCRLRRVSPSMLLHPLDFLGVDDEPELAYFPGMKLERERKREIVDWLLAKLRRSWRLGTIQEHLAESLASGDSSHGRRRLIHATSR